MMTEWHSSNPHLTKVLVTIHERLAQTYGVPQNMEPSDPTEELVRTILSQNTTDTNRDRAFARLREKFPTWESVANAPTPELAEAIRPGGLANVKAPRIRQVLHSVHNASGTYDLSFICKMPLDDAWRWLIALPGVGPKTASCVLLFSCRQPVMPVDTHVKRVASRLALLPERISDSKAHIILTSLTPPPLIYPLHLNLIKLGRRVCRPRAPLHSACVLKDVCAFAQGDVEEHRR